MKGRRMLKRSAWTPSAVQSGLPLQTRNCQNKFCKRILSGYARSQSGLFTVSSNSGAPSKLSKPSLARVSQWLGGSPLVGSPVFPDMRARFGEGRSGNKHCSGIQIRRGSRRINLPRMRNFADVLWYLCPVSINTLGYSPRD